ncbi:MAG: hypothetical protein ACI81R_002749 [Bradymonadia bacterium]|jgi:hypothetical protein
MSAQTLRNVLDAGDHRAAVTEAQRLLGARQDSDGRFARAEALRLFATSDCGDAVAEVSAWREVFEMDPLDYRAATELVNADTEADSLLRVAALSLLTELRAGEETLISARRALGLTDRPAKQRDDQVPSLRSRLHTEPHTPVPPPPVEMNDAPQPLDVDIERLDGSDDPELAPLWERLEDDASDLAAFETLTNRLAADERWQELDQAYRRMILLVQYATPRRPRLEAVLWRKLGGLLTDRLGRARDGLAAQQQALALHATRDSAMALAAAANSDAGADRAALWTAQRTASLEPEIVAIVARALREDDPHEHADLLDNVARLLAGDMSPSDARTPNRWVRVMTAPALAAWVRPPARDQRLDTLMEALHPVLLDAFAQDPSHYELSAKDTLPHDDSLPLSRVMQDIATGIGLTSPPTMHVYRHTTGLNYAFFRRPAFIVGRDLTRGWSEATLRYRVGQALGLRSAVSFLPGLLTAAQLQDVFASVFDWSEQSAEIQVTSESRRVKACLRAADAVALAPIRQALERFRRPPTHEELSAWRVQVGMELSRLGALCCEDVHVAAHEAFTTPPLRGGLDGDGWRRALLAWLGSESYHAARHFVVAAEPPTPDGFDLSGSGGL